MNICIKMNRYIFPIIREKCFYYFQLFFFPPVDIIDIFFKRLCCLGFLKATIHVFSM